MYHTMMRLLLLFTFGLCCINGCKENPFFKDGGPLVKTKSGSIIGKYIKVFDMNVAAFLGIPFAKPPLGEKRFKKTEPVEPWPGVVLTKTISPPCMQYTTRNFSWFPTSKPSEDCLYLNVWSPTRCCCDNNNKLPVLVWIYGGAFLAGSTDQPEYEGSTLAAFGEAIIVSMNYRVGIFGFLNDGTSLAPGNMGLYDQYLALKWVSENIEFFGGDPKSITLVGESAGAVSINIHMCSPLSKNLFHRAIIESGSAYHPGFIDTRNASVEKRNKVGAIVNCTEGSDPLGITHCLMQKNGIELAKAENEFTSKYPLFFNPTLGDEFLPKHPIKVFESGEIAPVDILTGILSHEGAIFLSYIVPDTFHLDQEPSINLDKAHKVMRELFKIIPEDIIKIIEKAYFKDIKANDSVALVQAMINAFGDFAFNCPVMFQAEKAKKAYVYWLTHRSLKNHRARYVGVTHFDEVPYVFGRPITDTMNFTPEDGRFSGDLIEKWMSFARTGNPSSPDVNQSWPVYSPTKPIVRELNSRHEQNIEHPRRAACEFLRPFFVLP